MKYIFLIPLLIIATICTIAIVLAVKAVPAQQEMLSAQNYYQQPEAILQHNVEIMGEKN